MSDFSQEITRKIAKLAHIGLTDAEVEKYTKDLGSILDYVKMLGELDTDAVDPLLQTVELENVLEEDQAKENLAEVEDLLKATALPVERRQIKVPPVL